MKISNSNLVLFLQLVISNGNINILLENGLQFVQISKLIDDAILKNFVKSDETGNLIITNDGVNKLKELNKFLKRKNSDQWISPLEYYKISKIEENIIYVPKLKNKSKRASKIH